MPAKLTQDQFIQRAICIHGNTYDYSHAQYTSAREKVKIICKTHGQFEQTPSMHTLGQGCPQCKRTRLSTIYRGNWETFVKRAQAVHGAQYDYSLVQYISSNAKVIISCVDHGTFEQTPGNHLQGAGCPKCAGKYKTTDEFIQQAKRMHGDKYDYSLTNYIRVTEKVTITCKTHGDFLQRPVDHVRGNGCPVCGGNQQSTTEQFAHKAHQRHNYAYDYSLVQYTSANTKVDIICKLHGVFKQSPSKHLSGTGCPKCGNWISEPETRWLDYNNVPNTPINRQVTIQIGSKRYKVDGYIPETNTVYEFWGDYWHGNPHKFEPSHLNVQTNKTFGELYEQTLTKRQAILDAGYNLVETWESDFD